MKKALQELRKIAQITDQKHWNCTEMRERALEEWIDNWIVELEYEQLVMHERFMEVEFEDFIKEHIAKKLSEQELEEVIEFTKGKNRIKGYATCLRRKAKN